MSKSLFSFRSFTSLLMFFSFFISLVSGIVLYFTPQGKIANWTHWTFWGLDKEMWGALHINSSLVLFVIAIVHFYFNWKVLRWYIKKKAVMALNRKYEFFSVVVISLFIVIATLYNIEPFRTIIRWNDEIKYYWENQTMAQPPIPHAEDMTVTEFCELLNIPVTDFKQKLAEKGWTIRDEQETIKHIASRYHISPAEIYRLFKNPGTIGQGQGRGQRTGQGRQQYGQEWGRKTLYQVAEQLNVDIDIAINRLAAKGIVASEDQQLSRIARSYGLRPNDIVEMIRTR